jgi:hypothetical protein
MQEEQPLIKAKLDHANYTVADTPYEFSVKINLDKNQLRRINETKGGLNIPMSDVIEDYPLFKKRLQHVFSDQYSLKDPEKLPLNFLLLNAGITGIKSPDPYGSMGIHGALTMPAVHAATMPTDVTTPDGRFKKILPVNIPHEYKGGDPYVFHHTPTHFNVDNYYDLISHDNVLNNQLVFPSSMNKEGTGGVVPGGGDVNFMMKDLKNRNKGLLMYGHAVNNDTVYPECRPTVTEMLTSQARSSRGEANVKSDFLVAIRNGSFPASWYQNDAKERKFVRDEGALTPIDNFANKMYHFIDSCNEARSTNFENCGMWWDIDHLNLEKVPKITAKIKFRIVPIVPYHEGDEKIFVPYHNFVKHLKNQLVEVDQPFK